MSPLAHVITSAASGAAITAATGSTPAGIACFLAGILIDVDHFLEYFWYEGLRLDIRDFRIACEETRFPKCLLILHSWEFLAIAWTVALFLYPSLPLRTALFGVTIHMAGDQAYNEPYPLTYFLAYRLWVRCDSARIFKTAARRQSAVRQAVEMESA